LPLKVRDNTCHGGVGQCPIGTILLFHCAIVRNRYHAAFVLAVWVCGFLIDRVWRSDLFLSGCAPSCDKRLFDCSEATDRDAVVSSFVHGKPASMRHRNQTNSHATKLFPTIAGG
jgi:hypothetical protein